jgi:hypothetical protein
MTDKEEKIHGKLVQATHALYEIERFVDGMMMTVSSEPERKIMKLVMIMLRIKVVDAESHLNQAIQQIE